jgi:hypothetical protein
LKAQIPSIGEATLRQLDMESIRNGVEVKKFFLLVYNEIPQNNMPKISKLDCM